MITQSRLKEEFEYDQETGIFTRKNIRTNAIKESGCLSSNGYRTIFLDGKNRKAHRMAWLYVYGETPEFIDHKNGNRDDNRIANLRAATRNQNAQNLQAAYANNLSSGILGVYWHSQSKKWQARIQVNGKAKSLGLFNDKKSAADAYAEAKKILHPFAHKFSA